MGPSEDTRVGQASQIQNSGKGETSCPLGWLALPLVLLCVIIARQAPHLRVQVDVPPTLRVQTVAYNYNSLGESGVVYGYNNKLTHRYFLFGPV